MNEFCLIKLFIFTNVFNLFSYSVGKREVLRCFAGALSVSPYSNTIKGQLATSVLFQSSFCSTLPQKQCDPRVKSAWIDENFVISVVHVLYVVFARGNLLGRLV